jgi:hypothetical protein
LTEKMINEVLWISACAVGLFPVTRPLRAWHLSKRLARLAVRAEKAAAARGKVHDPEFQCFYRVVTTLATATPLLVAGRLKSPSAKKPKTKSKPSDLSDYSDENGWLLPFMAEAALCYFAAEALGSPLNPKSTLFYFGSMALLYIPFSFVPKEPAATLENSVDRINECWREGGDFLARA